MKVQRLVGMEWSVGVKSERSCCRGATRPPFIKNLAQCIFAAVPDGSKRLSDGRSRHSKKGDLPRSRREEENTKVKNKYGVEE